MSDHAILSPSGAERWLSCTPSARLELKFADTSGAAASEGTLAHALGELLVRQKLGIIKKLDFNKELATIKKNPQFEKAMYDYMEEYALYVIELLGAAQKHTSDAAIFLEQRFDLSKYVPEGFGRNDTCIVANEWLHIVDLKYGKGVPVSAENNKQMQLYALGALEEFDCLYDIKMVRMTIYQPRLDSISDFDMSVADLKTWAKNELAPKAKLAFAGEGEFKPGLHCRFCKAKAVCKANADFNLQIAKHDFKEPQLLSDADITDILDQSKTFLTWINSVNDHAYVEALNGKRWPGYKLVDGRANRAYSNEVKVAKILKDNGYTEDVIFTKELLGITAMEKAITKPVFADLLSDLIIKPEGKPALVPESDKRPERNSVSSAKNDFLNQ